MPSFTPTKPEKHAWRRRYTDLVQAFLAEGSDVTPADAGALARDRTRAEWGMRFPSEPVPDWMP